MVVITRECNIETGCHHRDGSLLQVFSVGEIISVCVRLAVFRALVLRLL